MSVLSRYVGEQPTEDRDIPVASFSGNGGHHEHDRCLRRQQDKIPSRRNRPNTVLPKEKYWFRDFLNLFPRPGIFFGFFRQFHDFFEATELTVTMTKATQWTVHYRDRCSPTHRDSTPSLGW
jgi:hypothetical protein